MKLLVTFTATMLLGVCGGSAIAGVIIAIIRNLP